MTVTEILQNVLFIGSATALILSLTTIISSTALLRRKDEFFGALDESAAIKWRRVAIIALVLAVIGLISYFVWIGA